MVNLIVIITYSLNIIVRLPVRLGKIIFVEHDWTVKCHCASSNHLQIYWLIFFSNVYIIYKIKICISILLLENIPNSLSIFNKCFCYKYFIQKSKNIKNIQTQLIFVDFRRS